jgi:ribosomal protein S18 acetylase RimI-like enzyme
MTALVIPDCGQLAIEGPMKLDGNRDLFVAILVQVEGAQVADEITKDRLPPDSESWAFWAGPAFKPLGFATFYEVGLDRVWLDILYVSPGARRIGLATKLVEAVRGESRRHGCRRILFGTRPSNIAMVALAKRQGFEVESLNYAQDLCP